MNYRGAFTLLFFLTCISWCLTQPISHVKKRAMEDTLPANQLLTPYGIYPGIKPLRPILPLDILLNRFATPSPSDLTPMATFFKNKKDEFLNNLFDQLSVVTDPPQLAARSVVETDPTTPTSTPKPIIDTTAFKSKKFDFLNKLFTMLNATTVAPPTVPGVTPDATATTVKPTIVPPGFWAPVTKPPKPPKATKPPKPATPSPPVLTEVDAEILKEVLSELDPSNSVALSGKSARKVSFLDELLHKVTTTEAPMDIPSEEVSSIGARSVIVPPGYWIPPYIYAAKMGIYLDKLFDTIDDAAAADGEEGKDLPAKRSVGAPDSATNAVPPAPALILSQLTALKNDLLTAFAESAKTTTTPAPTGKAKKPFWGPKPTTPATDSTQSKIELLSQVFDLLADVQQSLLTSQPATASPSATTTAAPTLVPPSFWIPDPTAPDFTAYYKTKTKAFLSQLLATSTTATPPEAK